MSRRLRQLAIGSAFFVTAVAAVIIAMLLRRGDHGRRGGGEQGEFGVPGPMAVPSAVAVTEAIKSIGLRNYDATNVHARAVVLGPQAMPFLGGELAGKRTWALDFKNVRWPTNDGVNANIKSLVVTLAPDSAIPLTVVSDWPEGVPPMAPVPPAEEVAHQLKLVAHKYTGLPQTEPQRTLVEVLNQRETMGWGKDTRQVVAYYVMEETPAIKARPVWAVQVRGTGPFGREEVPIASRDHLMNVIDAVTGKWVWAATVPQPLAEDSRALP